MKKVAQNTSSQITQNNLNTSLSDAVKKVNPKIIQTIELIQKLNPTPHIKTNVSSSTIGTA